MEGIIYTLIFIIGILFGSFFTLAVYRIPLGEDILYKRSFCPNCKEKLRLKDLIPILSYIFLGGKCAYCGKKIKIGYLILEILSGLTFLLFTISLKINIYNVSAFEIANFIFYILYISSLFIIAGIDKENINIQKSLLVFGMVLQFLYMTYVCINNNSVYTYIIYLILTIILLFADTIYIKHKLHQSYVIQVLMLMLYMIIFSKSTVLYLTVVMTLILIAFSIIYGKRESKKEKDREDIKIPIGFYLCISNILLIILSNFLCNWVI